MDPMMKDCVTGPSCMRERCHAQIRRVARMLHDKAHRYEKLADELEHRGLDQESDQLLYDMVSKEFDRR